MRAALIYQHATSERDKEIADSLSARVEAAQAKEDGDQEKPGG